ncbi:MAG TPA: AMP-binding protein [Chloroflexota bacterium]
MLEDFRGCSIADIRQRFAWRIPQRFNIGVDASDNHPRGTLAIRHVAPDGSATDVSYGQLTDDSNRLANVLSAWGVRPGDRLAIILPQGPELAVAHVAAYKIGAIAVPMTTLFGPDALEVRLKDSGAKVAITDPPTGEKIATLALPALEHTVLTPDWDSALSTAATSFTPADTAADDPALLIYTSGTTGGPKGALHGHRVLLGHLPGFELSHDFYGQPGDRFWTPADWAWIGGLYDALFPVLHFGGTIVSNAAAGPFDPERALLLMARHEVHNTFLPPTALKLMRQADIRPPLGLRLRTIMSGGEGLGEEVLDWVRQRLGVTVNEIYGQTECNYVVGNSQGLFPVRPGSMGQAYVGHTATVFDPDERGLGEIAIRAPDPVMFLGYWNNPQATREKFSGDWLLTGDMATLDDDGYLWFKGREDDVINSAGYRIGPVEIEECLMRHPEVAMAAVIGVPDAIRGQAVKAFIVRKPGGSVDAVALQDFVRQRLAAYEYPRQIEFVESLPLTTTGKIRRTELRSK